MISKKGVISLFASCDNLESIQIYISPQFLCFVRLIDWLHNISPVQLWHRRWWPSPTPPLGSNAGEMWQILGWTLSELKKENFNCWKKVKILKSALKSWNVKYSLCLDWVWGLIDGITVSESAQTWDVLVHRVEFLLIDAEVTVRNLLLILGRPQQFACNNTVSLN